MKKIVLLIAVLIPHLFFAQESYVSPEIDRYVKFIENCDTNPVDYIMDLFEKHDVVVLGERDHRDTTQYVLIQQIVSDPRFIDKVGHVMTEVGVYNMANELNRVLKGNYPHDSIFDKELAKVEFDLQFIPLWDKTNYTQLHRDVYQVNKNLPNTKKISVTPTDVQFSWDEAKNMTTEEYKPFYSVWKQKDIIMGHNIINELYKIFKGADSRKKALIILNSPHSCRFYENEKYPEMKFYAYQIISDRFPGRCTNISLNWAVIRGEDYTGLTNEGKWDAAFTACSNKSIGFNLQGSPFGEDSFDMGGGWFPSKEIKYKNVYDGFIFYKPASEWVSGVGVPNLDKLDCKDELLRRFIIFREGTDTSEEFKNELYKYYTNIRYFNIFSNESLQMINDQIGRYYKPEKQ